MFVGTNIDCDVINVLWPKPMLIWKFDNQINPTSPLKKTTHSLLFL